MTISITRYAEEDRLVCEALTHALMQEDVEGEVLFIDQDETSNIGPEDFPDARLTLQLVRGRLPGLSHARNMALELANSDIVMFLDADALAQPGFAKNIAKALRDPKTAIAGARILPKWSGKVPFLAKARAVYDQFSLLDMGEETLPYHRVVGAGFGVDTSKLPDGFLFDEDLGRREGRLFGGEESDFCRRAGDLGFEVKYVGSAVVLHCIEPERLAMAWQIKRLFYAGYGRAQLGGSPQPGGKSRAADLLLAPIYMPPYLLGWVRGKLER